MRVGPPPEPRAPLRVLPTALRFRAFPAPSASDALRLCHYKQPDLLLLDVRLHDAFGLEVLREVRSLGGGDRAL
jgi:DNA-binding response OmpR family regulator